MWSFAWTTVKSFDSFDRSWNADADRLSLNLQFSQKIRANPDRRDKSVLLSSYTCVASCSLYILQISTSKRSLQAHYLKHFCKMPEQTSSQDKAAIFKIFEASLSSEQRQILLKHPDLLSPELVNQLYQASLERISAQHIEPGFTCRDMGIDDDGEVTPKKPRKMVNSWMAFRCKLSLQCAIKSNSTDNPKHTTHLSSKTYLRRSDHPC